MNSRQNEARFGLRAVLRAESATFLLKYSSVFALDQVAGDGFEAVGAAAVGIERGEGLVDELRGVAPALLDAIDCRPGGFFRGLIFAGGLAQCAESTVMSSTSSTI